MAGVDNEGRLGGTVYKNVGDHREAAFVLTKEGQFEAFHGVGLTTLASAYTDSGIMPMLSFTSTVASVRLPDGRTLPLFNELGGFSHARAASRDGHLLGGGGGSPFPTENYRHAIPSRRRSRTPWSTRARPAHPRAPPWCMIPGLVGGEAWIGGRG